jgi:hypothetical protein
MILVSCNNPYENENSTWTEDWIAIIDIDGNNIEYLYKDGSSCYWVESNDDSLNSKILISKSDHVEIMNQDGSDKKVLFESSGNVVCTNNSQTSFLMVYNDDILSSNISGSKLLNLTNTSDEVEFDPSYSTSDSLIVFSSYFDNQEKRINYLKLMNLNKKTETIVLVDSTANLISKPILINNDVIFFFKYYGNQDDRNGLYRLHIELNEVDFLFEGYVFDIKFNRYSNEILLNIDEYFCTFSSDLNKYGDIDNSSIVTSPNGEYVSFSRTNSYASLINWIDNKIIHIDHKFYSPSFNLSSTQFVCTVKRRYPDDF